MSDRNCFYLLILFKGGVTTNYSPPPQILDLMSSNTGIKKTFNIIRSQNGKCQFLVSTINSKFSFKNQTSLFILIAISILVHWLLVYSTAIQGVDAEVTRARNKGWTYVRSPQTILSSIEHKFRLMAQYADSWIETNFLRQALALDQLTAEVTGFNSHKLDEVLIQLRGINDKLGSQCYQNIQILNKLGGEPMSSAEGAEVVKSNSAQALRGVI